MHRQSKRELGGIESLLTIIGGLLSIFVMIAIGIVWGTGAIVAFIVGCLLFCMIGGPILKWYFGRQDRA
jgi:hypothetical protein